MSRVLRMLVPLVLLVLLQGVTRAEDFMCGDAAGCTARINEDGELQEIIFRKGDLVSTEAGWVVSPDDGWEKIGSKPPKPPCPNTPKWGGCPWCDDWRPGDGPCPWAPLTALPPTPPFGPFVGTPIAPLVISPAPYFPRQRPQR